MKFALTHEASALLEHRARPRGVYRRITRGISGMNRLTTRAYRRFLTGAGAASGTERTTGGVEMVHRSPAGSIDEYLAEFTPETRRVLEELRALITATAPGVTERISYGMPTFDLNGHYLVYFAGWKKHIGFYPVTAGVAAAFTDELGPYSSGKGSLQFPLAQPLPVDLIRRIVEFRVREVSDGAFRGGAWE